MRTPRRPFPLMAAVSVLLFACNQTPPSVQEEGLPPGSPYANGAQHPWSDRLDSQITDPYAAGRDYPWASPQAASRLQPQGLNTGVSFLSELQWTSATSGWGPIERNRSNGQMDVRDGGPLTIGGQTFVKGLGVHADSDVRYALNGQCSSFQAVIGIDDEVGALGRATFQVIGDGTVLYDSGELTGKDPARQVNVEIAGVRELQLKVLKGANTYYDHADWADAKVTCTAIQPTGDVVLSELPYISATNGWGPVEVERSNGEQAQFDGKPLTIGGQVFAKGLGMHASSNFAAELNYDLGGACTTLTASIGIDDEVGDRGSVVFQVYGDGQKLYDSGVVRGRDAARSISVDVKNVMALKLALTDAGDNMNFDHADWANPKITCAAGGTADSPRVQFSQSAYSVFHKHNASLPVTFKNISGPVSLRLEMGAAENITSSGLVLDTTTLTLNGAEQLKNIQISAPTLGEISPSLFYQPITAPYQLIVSQNGQDIARSPVTLTERLLEVRTSFEPSTVTAASDGSGTTTLVVKVSPPLDQPVEIFADDQFRPSVYDQILEPLGPTYGDGGTMRRDYRVNFAQIQPNGQPYPITPVIFAGSPGGFAGYRLPGYGTNGLKLTLIRPAP